MKVHPTAIVSKKAKIDSGVEIGPYAIIEDDVKIASGVKIYAHAYICNGTQIGEGTEVHMGAILGHAPQDLAFKGGKTYLKIGKNNIIREYATIHRATNEGTYTLIGDENYLMAISHVGHNCTLGNKVILANGALLAGHVNVEDGVFISGNVVIHQFCRIGKLAIIGGYTAINKDVPPYMAARGESCIRAINLIGLKRAGISREAINEIKKAFRLIYRSDMNTTQALDKILEDNPGEEVRYLVGFIKSSKRGICKNRYVRGNFKKPFEE